MNAAGDITVDADSTTAIKAVTIAGAISGSGPSGTATPSTNIQIAGAGAGSGNSVDNDIEASIVGSASTPAPAIQAGGGIRVEATDQSTIEADAGGVAIAFAVSKDSSMFSLAIGLSAAKNDITNTVDAKITGSTVLAKGKLEGTGDGVLVRANSTSTIKALTLAGAGVSGGIAGSGAGSGNDIANDITSQISGSSNVEAQDGTLIVAAEDTSTIKADAGALSIAITITSNNPNTVRLAAGIGITVAINDIENDVRAIVDGSVAKAKGNASVTAFSRPSIEVFSLSGTAGGSIDTGQSGGTLAVAFFGAGTGSGNEIDNIVEALVRNGATLESTDGTATVSATMPTPASGAATIVAKAIGVAVSVGVSGSTINLSIAIGIAVAVNAIGQDATRGNIVRAKVTGATVKSKTGSSVTTSATPAIDALAVGIGIAVQVQNGQSGTLSLSGAGTGAVSLNKIDTVVESLVEASSTVSASGGARQRDRDRSEAGDSRATTSSRPPWRRPGRHRRRQLDRQPVDLDRRRLREERDRQGDDERQRGAGEGRREHRHGDRAIDVTAESNASIKAVNVSVAISFTFSRSSRQLLDLGRCRPVADDECHRERRRGARQQRRGPLLRHARRDDERLRAAPARR